MIVRATSRAEGERRPGAGRSLRVKLAVLAGFIVAAVIALTTTVAFWLSDTTHEGMLDTELRSKTLGIARQLEGADADTVRAELEAFHRANPMTSIAVSSADDNTFIGDPVPVAGPYTRTPAGDAVSARSVSGERIVVRRTPDGMVVAAAQSEDPYGRVSGSRAAALLVVIGVGSLLAWISGALISAVGLTPVRRLHRELDTANESTGPRELPVEGDDEFAAVTASINTLINSLEDSKQRQAQLVADAGHELKTPLTSMRTNIELLMMLYNSGREDQISKEDRADLERDVLAQMEEMSILIGDLVNLARDESHETEPEDFRLDEVLEEALDRVRRRRPDVTFLFHADPWVIRGDRFAMGRAPINLIDNAAKWSPQGGTVRVSLKAAKRNAVLIVDDSGPGIPPEERAKVFERFYRAPESRAMPGSGLGLAIVKQVMDRHGATIVAEESDDGGARFRVVFPGRPPSEDASVDDAEQQEISSRVIPKKSYG